MAKRVKKTKTMSEAIKPTLKKAPKKATPKKATPKKATPKKATSKKGVIKEITPTKKTAPKKRVTASVGRKRITKKPIIKVPVVSKTDPNLKVVSVTRDKKRLIDDNRYIKVSSKSKNAKFVEMGLKVQRGEVKWSYYTTENDIGYHYYKKLKQK